MDKMEPGVRPLITFVIAVYNADKTLQQCLDSVTQQTSKNFELVVLGIIFVSVLPMLVEIFREWRKRQAAGVGK